MSQVGGASGICRESQPAEYQIHHEFESRTGRPLWPSSSAVRWADWIDECTRETLKMGKPKRTWAVGAHQPGTEVT